MTIRSPGGRSFVSEISIAIREDLQVGSGCGLLVRQILQNFLQLDRSDEVNMKQVGTLIVMSGEYIGGPQGSWQAMYTHWGKITNQLYRYSSWDHFEKDILYLFDLDTGELISARTALASGPGFFQIKATPKHPA